MDLVGYQAAVSLMSVTVTLLVRYLPGGQGTLGQPHSTVQRHISRAGGYCKRIKWVLFV